MVGQQKTRAVWVQHESSGAADASRVPSYGWVIVAASTILLAMQGGTMFSFGVFFKPLSEDFGWSRAATSGVYSVSATIVGLSTFLMGWLADRYGPKSITVLCALALGLGLLLTSQVNALWQIYLTYGLIAAVGLGGAFAIPLAATARWFPKRRGLALGIVSSGTALGSLIMSPAAERLIAVFDWSGAYLIIGLVAWALMIPSALLLRRGPGERSRQPDGMPAPSSHPSAQREMGSGRPTLEAGIALEAAVRTKALWMLFFIFGLFTFGLHIIMVHVVSYATDGGIGTAVAASLISVIGICSLAGRLVIGSASDRMGSTNTLMASSVVALIALVWLIFASEVWMFYLFAIVFGFAYGGQAPQVALQVHQFFGLRAVATLVGVVSVGAAVGGALGALAGGQVFDATGSYRMAFALAASAAGSAAMITLLLRKQTKVAAQTGA